MKAAIVQAAGQNPIYSEFPAPQPVAGQSRVIVTAAAVSPLVRGRASGSHYSSEGKFPFIVGVDGVGRLDDGTRIYFVLPTAPYGSMAEQTLVPSKQWVPVPPELDDVSAAAIANPGMSSWAALTERARLQPGETVLINGATGSAGRLAVQIAKHLGARKVIVTGRNADVLRSLTNIGADATIVLGDDLEALEADFRGHFASGVDIVIDYLWGQSAERLLIAAAKAGRESVPMRFVQVGSSSGPQINLQSAVLRSTAITLMGSGIGSVPADRLLHAISGVFSAAIPAGFKIATQAVPLSDFEKAWPKNEGAYRTVFTMHPPS